ncbi:MAG TPA: protein translocase subunit SecD, partial [Candidatus Babeliales bacterium]|nr:protein translocase subunit SecD [Candidatus Babeliales bacterium]
MTGFTFWVVLALGAGYMLYPLRKKLKFGIDLVGGTYITLDVQTEKALEHELNDKSNALYNSLKSAERALPTGRKVNERTITFTFASGVEATDAAAALSDQLSDAYKLNQETETLTITMADFEANRLRKWALDSNVKVLRARLNKLGVEEVKVAPQGERSVVVELPDVSNPAKAKEMIGTPAMLEFKIVEAQGASRDQILDEFGGDLPEGMEIIAGREGKEAPTRYFLVAKHADVTGAYLKDAQPAYSSVKAEMVVTFKLTPEGGEKFYVLTGENKGRLLAAILDNKVISVATIQDAISTDCQITGNFTKNRAQELCSLFKSGAFEAPVTFAEERRIGPSLGYASISKGLLSCAIGLGLLLLFSLFFYKLSGVLAFLTLLYNLLLLLLCMALSGATLTLPGIAGMVLTVGMAIDSSILIFERIKEMLAAGMPVRQAVDDGFANAAVVILDANITTFIVGVVLFKFGTGPIQG